jgi:sulfoxide reductase heme-binding subunit YedZ
MIRRLGGKWWQRLHRSIYVIAIGGVIHYLWLVKADIRQPLIYGGLLGLLLTYRLWAWSELHVKWGITHIRTAATSK